MGDPARLSIAQCATDVAALLDHLDIDAAVLGGISLGAAISMRLAASTPWRIKALILARPAWVDEPAPPRCIHISCLQSCSRTTDGKKG